jgi:hypothetical protein
MTTVSQLTTHTFPLALLSHCTKQQILRQTDNRRRIVLSILLKLHTVLASLTFIASSFYTMSHDPSMNDNAISFYQPGMMEMEMEQDPQDDHGNALMDRTTQENHVNHDDGMMVKHHQASKNDDNGNKQDSEFDAITRDAALLLEKKLANTKGWAKKLLQEITVYVETVEQAQAEYMRVQRLEHEESNRLDQVEPEVHGATTFSHSYNGGGSGGGHHHQNVASYQQHGAPNEYLDDDGNVDTENMGPFPSRG